MRSSSTTTRSSGKSNSSSSGNTVEDGRLFNAEIEDWDFRNAAIGPSHCDRYFNRGAEI
jgi:hypothetical protein